MSILSFMGIADALAAAAPATAAAAPSAREGIVSVLPMLIAFVAIFYFLLIRPQSKRAKEQRALLAAVKKGDEVTTSGGLLGRVVRLGDDFIVLAIADNVEVTVQKPAVTALLPKGTLKSL